MKQEQEILKLRKERQELLQSNFEQSTMLEELQGTIWELEIENQELNRKLREANRKVSQVSEREAILIERYKRRIQHLKKGIKNSTQRNSRPDKSKMNKNWQEMVEEEEYRQKVMNQKIGMEIPKLPELPKHIRVRIIEEAPYVIKVGKNNKRNRKKNQRRNRKRYEDKTKQRELTWKELKEKGK